MPEEDLSHLLNNAYRSVSKMDDEFLALEGLTDVSVSELHLLNAIGYAADGCTIGDIAQALSITMPSVTVAVNKLRDKGYVGKRKSEADKRSVEVSLSRRGRRVHTAYKRFNEQMLQTINDELAAGEKQVLIRAIRAVNRSFHRVIDEGRKMRQAWKSKDDAESETDENEGGITHGHEEGC